MTWPVRISAGFLLCGQWRVCPLLSRTCSPSLSGRPMRPRLAHVGGARAAVSGHARIMNTWEAVQGDRPPSSYTTLYANCSALLSPHIVVLCRFLVPHLPFFFPPFHSLFPPPLKVLASPRVLPPALLARRRRRRLVYRPRPVWCPRLVWWPQFSRWRRLPRWRQVRWRQTQRGGLRQRPERAHDHGDRAGRGVSWRPHRPRAICRRAGLGGSCGCGGGCCCCCGGGGGAGSSRSSRSPHGRDGG